jgi:hypothetical protein
LQGIQQYAKATVYAEGCGITSKDKLGIAKACDVAKSAQVTIIIAGLTVDVEGEGNDRASLTWPGVQVWLRCCVVLCCVSGYVCC